MSKLQDLRQSLATAVDALNSEEILADAKKFADQEVVVKEIRGQIERSETAQKAAASLAAPLDATQRDGIVTNRPVYGEVRSFKGKNAREEAFRTGQFIRASMFGAPDALEFCKANGITITRASAESSNAAGGVLVPEEMMNSIIILRETYGVFRKECRTVPMGRDTLNWPRRTGGLTAYFTSENTALTESTASFDDVTLTAKKLAVLTKLSTEIAEDAVISIADYLVQEIAYAFASKEDDCGFNGDGTSTYGGIQGLTVKGIAAGYAGSKYTAATNHNTFATLDGTDITGAMGLLPQYALPNAKFYISQLGFATCFERLVAAAGGNSISTLDGSVQYRYLGFPIVISQKLPAITTTLTGKAMLFFGDLSLAAAMGERRGVTIRRLDERFADADQVGIMGTERFDINVHDLGDATNAGPLISLVAP